MSDRPDRATTKVQTVPNPTVAVELDLEDPKSVTGFFEELAAMLKVSTKVRITVEFLDHEMLTTRNNKP